MFEEDLKQKGMNDLSYFPDSNGIDIESTPPALPFSSIHPSGNQPVLNPPQAGGGFYDYFMDNIPHHTAKTTNEMDTVYGLAPPGPRSMLIWIMQIESTYDNDFWATAEAEWDQDIIDCEAELDHIDLDFLEVHVTPMFNYSFPEEGWTTKFLIPDTRTAPNWATVEFGEAWKNDGYFYAELTDEQRQDYIDKETQRILGNMTVQVPVSFVYYGTDFLQSWHLTSRWGYFAKETQIELAVGIDYAPVHITEDPNWDDGPWLKAVKRLLRLIRYMQYNIEPANPSW